MTAWLAQADDGEHDKKRQQQADGKNCPQMYPSGARADF